MAVILDGGRGHRTQLYYPRTIHAMFALNWLTGFRGEDFKKKIPIGPMLKLCLLKATILDGGQGHRTQF